MINKKLPHKILILCLLSAFALAGCIRSALDPGPAPDRVLLNIPTPKATQQKALDFQLLVSTPELGFDLDTDNIALVFNNNMVRYLKDAKWASPTPKLIQRLVLDSLESNHILGGVVDETAGIYPDYKLTVHVKEFQFNYQNAEAVPSAEATFTLRLINTSNSTIVATTNIKHSTPATAKNLQSLIKAMEQTMALALDDCGTFVRTNFESLEAKNKTKSRK